MAVNSAEQSDQTVFVDCFAYFMKRKKAVEFLRKKNKFRCRCKGERSLQELKNCEVVDLRFQQFFGFERFLLLFFGFDGHFGRFSGPRLFHVTETELQFS